MLQRIYIKDAAIELNCTVRTFSKWCFRYNVGILKDEGSKKRYVIKEEFEIAKSREAIKYIQRKYGVSDFFASVQSQAVFIFNNVNKTKPTYTPTGNHEKNFINKIKLQNNFREL